MHFEMFWDIAGPKTRKLDKFQCTYLSMKLLDWEVAVTNPIVFSALNISLRFELFLSVWDLLIGDHLLLYIKFLIF